MRIEKLVKTQLSNAIVKDAEERSITYQKTVQKISTHPNRKAHGVYFFPLAFVAVAWVVLVRIALEQVAGPSPDNSGGRFFTVSTLR